MLVNDIEIFMLKKIKKKRKYDREQGRNLLKILKNKDCLIVALYQNIFDFFFLSRNVEPFIECTTSAQET